MHSMDVTVVEIGYTTGFRYSPCSGVNKADLVERRSKRKVEKEVVVESNKNQ